MTICIFPVLRTSFCYSFLLVDYKSTPPTFPCPVPFFLFFPLFYFKQSLAPTAFPSFPPKASSLSSSLASSPFFLSFRLWYLNHNHFLPPSALDASTAQWVPNRLSLHSHFEDPQLSEAGISEVSDMRRRHTQALQPRTGVSSGAPPELPKSNQCYKTVHEAKLGYFSKISCQNSKLKLKVWNLSKLKAFHKKKTGAALPQ